MAFISLSNTNSGKGKVHTASFPTASVPTTSTQVSTASTNVAAASISHDTICAYIASQSNGSQIKYEDITQIDEDDIKEIDIKWNMDLLSMRVDRAPRSQDKGKRESYKQGPKEEEPAPKALMAIDGIGWDWSYMANEEENHALVADDEAPTEFALMAKSSSSSKNKVKKEKEGLANKLIGFESASKYLDTLLRSQRTDKNKEGLGYNAVPPLLLKSTHLLRKICLGLGNSQNNIDDKGYWDSGCSRHMTGNISYLFEYQPYDEGYVPFGQGGGKITDYKLKDDTNVLLRTPKQHNMYSIDLNNVVPHKNLTCLVAEASVNERKQHKASCKTKLVNSMSKPLHTLHMDLFGPTSVSSLNHKWYCLVVTDDFSRNSTLIEAARTMLADAKLPVTFWAEAVNTACYVQNRVLVNKSQNKTQYELFNSRTPAIGFLRPFRCYVMILSTLDHLGKFDAKGDKGYFVGYSMSSKAFRVFNKRTKKVEENLHVDFLKNKLIEKGAGPNWLFNIDTPTNSMNYVPVVVAGTSSTNISGTKDVASQAVKKDERGIVIRNKVRLVAQGHTQEEGIDYKEVFALVARIDAIRLFLAYASFMGFIVYQMDVKSAFLYGTIDEELCREFKALMYDKFQMSAMGELTFFLGLQVLQKKDGIFLSQDKYVGDILKKFGYSDVRSANTPMDKENPWGKDGPAVKRIFRYLKGHPKLGLWYPKESPFDLVAYSNSDYGGATQDKKSTTGEYVAAASGCGQVLWIQNQMMDYGQDTTCPYIASQSSGSQIKFEDINQIDEDNMEEIDIKWNMALLRMRADKFWKKTGKKISI
nr:copia protein [Tanacetum cinerariifolium]